MLLYFLAFLDNLKTFADLRNLSIPPLKSTVLNAAFTAYNIYGTSITPALLATFLWKRATSQGAIASIITGTTITIIWTFFLPNWSGYLKLHPLLQELTYPAAGLSIFALVSVSLMTPAPKAELLEKFFNDN